MMRNFLKEHSPEVLAFILGLSSVIGQVLLLRELITVFYGNETAYAIILASWLFWVAVGSLIASGFTSRIKNPARSIPVLYLLIAIILPVTIIVTRFLKIILGVQTGEIIGLGPMCLSAYLLLAPLTMLFGGLFTIICRYNESLTETPRRIQGIGTIYIWESAGAAVGGFLFSFVLIHFMDALGIALVIAIVAFVAILLLSAPGKLIFKIGTAGIALCAGLLITGLVKQIDHFTRQAQWRGLKVVASADSIYGNLTLIRLGQDYSLYENGLLSYTTRDEVTSEEDIHFPMLEHPDPRRVLLIGNGLGGGLREILKYPQATVDYVELDPEVIRVSQRYLDKDYLGVLSDPRVKVIYRDGRWLVKRTKEKYDVIIINLGDPYTAMINRYYTNEFFKEASRILNPDGVLSLSVSSSENYLSEETRAYLRSIYATLRAVFLDVKSIPGDSNIFLASQKAQTLTLDDKVITQRLKQRNIQTRYVREYNLPFRLSPDRIRESESILQKTGQLNTDTQPIAYLYDIILWSTHFGSRFQVIMSKLQVIKPFHVIVILPFLLLLGGGVFRKINPLAPVTLSIMTTGFSEIIFQILVILAFQTLYGYAYYSIGLIIASFMAGLVLGSVLARRLLVLAQPKIWRVYLAAQMMLCLFPLIIPVIFVIFSDSFRVQQFEQLFAATFALLPVVAGFLGGLQYPLALKLIEESQIKLKRNTATNAGILYGIDVFGATLGALVSGTLLIPLLGINILAYMCLAINGVVLILLLLTAKSTLLKE